MVDRTLKIERVTAALEQREADQVPTGEFFWTNFLRRARAELGVGDDFDADMAKMAADPTTQKWWDVCKPLLDPLETRNPGEFWAGMEEVFHCP